MAEHQPTMTTSQAQECPQAQDQGREPVLPAYGRSTLCEVLGTVTANLGVSDGVRALPLRPAERTVLVLVDGLGLDVLRAHPDQAPYLHALLDTGLELTSGVPSTTATSLSCLGTGLPPGRHGIVGYSFRAHGQVMNALTWDVLGIIPEAFQPNATLFERASEHGIAVHAVVPERFADSALTRASLRGQQIWPVRDEYDDAARIEQVVQATSDGRPSMVYFYERLLDHVGHAKGVADAGWRQQLARIDTMIARLRERLDDDVVLLVTGDHGMVDVPADGRVVIQQHGDLTRDVRMIAGEPRLRQLYGPDPQAIAGRWAERLGDRAWIRTRAQALDEGWFGDQVDLQVNGRIGDVLVAMLQDWALMSTDVPNEFGLVGMHGSLTHAEMVVPLLVSDERTGQ